MVVIEHQSQAGAESNDLYIDLVRAVGLDQVAGHVQHQCLLGGVGVAYLKNNFLFREWLVLSSVGMQRDAGHRDKNECLNELNHFSSIW